MEGRRSVLKALGATASLGLTAGCLKGVQNTAGEELRELTPPFAAFSIDYTLQTETLTIMLIQGSKIPSRHVHIRGKKLTRVGSWAALGGETTGPDNTIAVGNHVTVQAQHDYTVRVTWEKYGLSQTYIKETGDTI